MGRFLGQQNIQKSVKPTLPQKAKVTFANIPDEYKLPGATFTGGGFKLPINRKFEQSEYKDLASAEALTRDIADLRSIVAADKAGYANDGNPLKASQFLGSGAFSWGPLKGLTNKGQRFALKKKSVGERLLRLRSGAQINENEYKRFMELLPTIFRDDDLDIEQLDNFTKEFESISGRINQGSLYNPKSKGFDISESDIQETMRQNNMTREQVLKALGA